MTQHAFPDRILIYSVCYITHYIICLFSDECRQRQLLREQRHRERIEKERLLPQSPPPVVHYSEHEAATLSEKLKGIYTKHYKIAKKKSTKSHIHKIFMSIPLVNAN